MHARLLEWYAANARDLPWRRTHDPYAILVSEIMLQQTQVAVVVPYYERFIARFPDVRALAHAGVDDVLALWSGLGYYSRARNLHLAAREVMQAHSGEFPRDFETLVALPGVGRSTAAAIAAFASGERRAILDGNVRRVLARHAGIGGDPAGAKQQKDRDVALSAFELGEVALRHARITGKQLARNPSFCAGFSHAFTHFTLDVRPVRLAVRRPARLAAGSGLLWMPLSELRGAALPAPVRRLLDQLLLLQELVQHRDPHRRVGELEQLLLDVDP